MRAHEQIAKDRMREADCFVYVTQAGRTLSDQNLELLRTLYAHQSSSRKPVLWVATAIDRADQLGEDNRPEWKSTVEVNNRYLKEKVVLREHVHELDFLGSGFVGVSPAWEAQGKAMLGSDPAEADELMAASNMAAVRDQLKGMIADHAGCGT